ncbi:hypothetical protein CsSME_00008051 [Camellia sinensis var. sinensis]
MVCYVNDSSHQLKNKYRELHVHRHPFYSRPSGIHGFPLLFVTRNHKNSASQVFEDISVRQPINPVLMKNLLYTSMQE